MIEGRSTEREMWLQLACLAVSIGLHAGLVVIGWQGFSTFQGKDRTIVVTLGERPAPPPMQTGPVVADSRKKLPLSASLRLEVPASSRANSPVMESHLEDPVRAVPEVAVIKETTATLLAGAAADDPLPVAGEPAGSASSITDGAGLESGSAAQGDGLGQDAGERAGVNALIRATPRYEFNPKPDYPAVARQSRWEGTVRVRARVTGGGTVDNVSLERSSGHAMLDRSVLDSVRHWRFIPATRGGVPVACEVSIPVAFKLTE